MVFDEMKCSDEDARYMLEALKEAEAAADAGEVPVGAVIVRNGSIIARSGNMVERKRSSSAHAEMLAMDQAEEILGAKWLTDCTVYVTLEPCSMCAGAMVLARIGKLVIGADDPKTGACGSVFDIAGSDRLNHLIEIRRGVLGEQCAELLKDFFRMKRLSKNDIRRNI